MNATELVQLLVLSLESMDAPDEVVELYREKKLEILGHLQI